VLKVLNVLAPKSQVSAHQQFGGLISCNPAKHRCKCALTAENRNPHR